jgi:drug/metabolite transporter (DMT)-like permease
LNGRESSLGLIGIALLNLGSNLQASPLGAAMVIFAASTWAFGSVWSRYLPLPAPDGQCLRNAGGGCDVLLIGSYASGERMTQSPGVSGWLVMAYLVVFGSIVAFSSYMYLLKNVRPAAATSYCYVNPAVAVLLGVLFADEHIGGPAEAAAMAVIISAVVLIGLPQWRKQKPVQKG